MKLIHNIRLIHKNTIHNNKAVIYDNKIVDIVDINEISEYMVDEKIDGKNMFLAPGFIDVHVHGCSSFDVMDEDENALIHISQNLAKTGVTSFLPTTMTMEFSKIENALKKIKLAMNKDSGLGAQILGAHLEGPFISKIFKGAHDENNIIPPDSSLLEAYKEIIKIITLAPELDGSMTFIKYCNANNIIVSIGHTNAEYEVAALAIDQGAKHFTHTYNAMTPLRHRSPGAVGAAMLHDVTCELIADNIHVHPAAQKILLKLKGYKKLILVTDAMRACLMCDGEYNLGGQRVQVSSGEARLENGTLAGSVLTLNIALKHIIENTEVTLPYAIEMITSTPARLLNLCEAKGTIDIGKDSDMVIFDDAFDIHYTIVNGKVVYRR